MTRNTLTILLGILVVINVVFFFDFSKDQEEDARLVEETILNQGQAYILPVSEPSYIPILDSTVSRPMVDGRSALVYDTRSSRFLFEKNTKQQLPIASLTKILSAIVVVEELNTDAVVRVPHEAIRVDEEKQDLYLDEEITVANLMQLMLVQSSNDASYALAFYATEQDIDFVEEMNKKATEIGMVHSEFLDPAGLSDLAYSTAEDLIRLVEYSLQYRQIWNTLREERLVVSSVNGGIQHDVRTTNKLLGVVQGIVGGKTGYTDGALGCMILVADAPEGGESIISIVIGSNERFVDIEKLINWTRTAYRWQ